MPEPILLLLALVVAGILVTAPLRRPAGPAAPDADEHEAAAVRHRVALEALRDVEVDRRAGSLDERTYAAQLADAEARAAGTRAALDAIRAQPGDGPPYRGSDATRVALAAAAFIGLALVIGSVVPATGVANQTAVNEPLAAAQQAEADRQDRIAALLERVAADPRDAAALSELADAYLAGSSEDDLVRAAVALRLLIDADPERADAYERIVTAYIRAGDYRNARTALDAYAERSTADPTEVAFFEGIIELRGEDDPAAALAAFERFLELAPDDPRAGMIRGLRDEAASAAGD